MDLIEAVVHGLKQFLGRKRLRQRPGGAEELGHFQKHLRVDVAAAGNGDDLRVERYFLDL
ncbi:MAG: hypothetical protein IH994_09840 [Proteobacteria bacterium]|nr:hypothetical protein [Pseudomonadota bacterium]